VQSQDITIEIDGKQMPCYLSRPDGEGPLPAVIVLAEIFGVNLEVRRISDLLASAGYVALAPNYYYRTHPNLNEPYTPEGLQNGFAAARSVTKANLREDVAAAIDWLVAQPFVEQRKIATWGFCIGGTVAFVTATLPGLACSVAFYGSSIVAPMPSGEPEALADVKDLRAPLLLVFGGQDEHIPPAAVARIEKALSAADKRFEIQIYPNVGHAFFRDSSEGMSAEEVADAWDRVQAFLERHMT
jgi:carboxymethylenebutenolidase